jgi:hypothetical protein
MQYQLCRHIRTNGLRCKAAALTDNNWCYFHANLYQRHQSFRQTADSRRYLIPGQHLELAPLEDREAVQVSLSVVINALATGQLEPKRATALLYGLQLASMNAGRLNTQPCVSDGVRTIESSPEGLALAEPRLSHETDFIEVEEDDYDDEDE